MNVQEYIDEIASALHSEQKTSLKRKTSSLLKALSTKELTTELAAELSEALQQKNITASPAIHTELSAKDWLEFSFAQNPTLNQPWFQNEKMQLDKLGISPFCVQEDFFQSLFDFGSRRDYEHFQSALDSYQPVAIFLLPEEEDFFADVVERVLSFELIKKNFYRDNVAEPTAFYSHQLAPILKNDEKESGDIDWDDLQIAQVLHFRREEVESVVLGQSAIEMLESTRFSTQFDRIASYAHRYGNKQFFVIFHVPSIKKIEQAGRGHVLNALIDRVAQRLPFTFTLRAKYKREADIPQPVRNNIFNHFRLLNEQPSQALSLDLSLNDCFGELQKNFLHAHSSMFYNMENQVLFNLRWNGDVTQHERVYSKYFALQTLTKQFGYSLEDITCEEPYAADTGQPEIKVKNDSIYIFIEDLGGRSKDKNVYLDLYNYYVSGLEYWPESLQELWIVFPCFEVARNSYQVQKFAQLLNQQAKRRFNRLKHLFIFVSDYTRQCLSPISFEALPQLQLDSPDIINPKTHVSLVKQKDHNKISFADVIGLKEEKDELHDLVELQNKGFNLGFGGIIFYGLPGCGKTHLAHAFANELNRNFYSFSPAEIVSKWIGESAQNVRDIFNEARSKGPSLLFIDEIDSIGFSRDEDGAHSDQRATINQILIEMNNVNEKDILVIAATNRLSSLDKALVRAGRFDYKVPIFPPLVAERNGLFRYYLERLGRELNPHFPDCVALDRLNFDWLAEETAGLAPADIKSVISKLRIDIIRNRIQKTTNSDVFRKVKLLQETGQLTLNYDLIQNFIAECQRNGYSSEKLEALKAEWNIL